ncbi:NAD-dependent protein deacetylase sirtuin-2-like isoform X1 [Argonauta hians]
MSDENASNDKDVPEAESPENADGPHPGSTSSWLRNLFGNLNVNSETILPELSINGIAEHIKSGRCKNIIILAGAGLSTAAGLPDFRSPSTGLYETLDLPNPQDLFSIRYFRKCPEPFFKLIKELWPRDLKPTLAHYFVKLLDEKGLLLRHFTQNIDGLERLAGIDLGKLVEGHGTFHTSHCLDCKAAYDMEWLKDKIFKDGVPHCPECDGVVKPDVVLFGEMLPNVFFEQQKVFKDCDLLIILGTSLTVAPFSTLVSMVSETTPRLCINISNEDNQLSWNNSFDEGHGNTRDVFWKGTCDGGCQKLAELLGYEEELKELVTKGNKSLEDSNIKTKED